MEVFCVGCLFFGNFLQGKTQPMMRRPTLVTLFDGADPDHPLRSAGQEEEADALRQFPEEYRAYMARSLLFLPAAWPRGAASSII